jgi:hypothetical protein
MNTICCFQYGTYHGNTLVANCDRSNIADRSNVSAKCGTGLRTSDGSRCIFNWYHCMNAFQIFVKRNLFPQRVRL